VALGSIEFWCRFGGVGGDDADGVEGLDGVEEEGVDESDMIICSPCAGREVRWVEVASKVLTRTFAVLRPPNGRYLRALVPSRGKGISLRFWHISVCRLNLFILQRSKYVMLMKVA
jgi:hypothetical protein